MYAKIPLIIKWMKPQKSKDHKIKGPNLILYQEDQWFKITIKNVKLLK